MKKGADSISDFVLRIKNVGDALLATSEDVKDRDLVVSLMYGVGHDFDSIVSVITAQQRFITFEDAHFLLLTHEQRLHHLDSSSQLDIGQSSANYATNSSQEKKKDT
ncbi:hypothetical protein Ddye_013990 [Dipteronia dyeriana]|uniref:Uncharacterized protein n=1 Tax=Dipteronia dyeriana TaxID=168575 RepID=A0AAD9X7F1_9ROSI|nr:hypothetical protein Ddye_013990 [Dipteronia dyeriana]